MCQKEVANSGNCGSDRSLKCIVGGFGERHRFLTVYRILADYRHVFPLLSQRSYQGIRQVGRRGDRCGGRLRTYYLRFTYALVLTVSFIL